MTSNRKTVLYIVHNHPSVRPGGAEAYALELYEAMRNSREFRPVLLAKAGPPVSKMGQVHSGTHIGHFNADSDQYYLHTEAFDWFNGVQFAKVILTQHFREFLEAVRPDVVHFQHTLFLGYDMIREVRNTLPDAIILYTLQEYLPICHRQGQMLRPLDNTPCAESSPMRCHECFPQHSPQDFFMRKMLVQSHFSLVDLFLAPSRFLLERYVDWGIPREKIVFEEYGRNPMSPLPPRPVQRPRNRFAFFGQLSPYKGVNVLLEAMAILAERHTAEPNSIRSAEEDSPIRPHLWVHGANLDLQEVPFQNRVKELLEGNQELVTFAGKYSHSQLPALMTEVDWVIVPSIWWENSPLVIQEAFGHGRPVICSDIGGMAEKVAHGVNGLHFRAGDPARLADAIQEAASTPGLWDKLASGIPRVYPMQDHTNFMQRTYRRLAKSAALRRAA